MKSMITVWAGNKNLYDVISQVEEAIKNTMDNTENHIIITIETIESMENN